MCTELEFLYFGDYRSFLFAPIQLFLLTFFLGKMLNPDAMFPLPTFSSEFWTYIKQTFLRYKVDMSQTTVYKRFVESLLNGDTANVDPTILATIVKIGLGYKLIRSQIHNVTLPFYFWFSLISNGVDLCDIKADEVEEEGIVSYLSLTYHCVLTVFVMYFGSIALMRRDPRMVAPHFILAILLTNFSEIKKVARERNLTLITKFVTMLNPSQRTLELKPCASRKKYNAFEEAYAYGNLAISSLVTHLALI